MLIDDSLDNCMDCAKSGIPVLLFGDYEWNKRRSGISAGVESMGFEEREKVEGTGRRWWVRDDVPDERLSPLIRRVGGWDDVLRAVRETPASP